MSLIFWSKSVGSIGQLSDGALDRDDCFTYTGDAPPSAGQSDVVLVFGAGLVDTCRKAGIITSKQHMNTLRKKVMGDGPKWLVTYSPGILTMDSSKRYDLSWDIRRAVRLHDTGKVEPDLPEYDDVSDFSDVVNYVANQSKSGRRVPLALDCETVGFFPYYPDKPLVSVQVTYKEGQASVLVLDDGSIGDKALEQLNWLVNTPRVMLIGANLKFDMHWLWEKLGIECSNYSFDTMLVGTLLDENRSNSLEMHAKVYTEIGGYDEEMAKKDKARMDLVDRKVLVDYAGGDSDATYRVAKVFSNELRKDRKLKQFYTRLLHPASKGFESMERTGVCIDRDKMDQLGSELEGIMAEQQERALSYLPRKLRIKHADNLKPTKAALVRDFMFTKFGLNLTPKMRTEKKGDPSTSEEHLKLFVDHPDAAPFIEAVLEYSGAQKTKSTYVDGFLEHLRPDGRLHPSYFLHVEDDGGTVTGRTSAKNPPIQCQPGWSMVLTDKGPMRMDSLIQSLHDGQLLHALSHDGSWHRIYEPHDNGIAEIYELSLSDGKVLHCTANHPVLTCARGWVEVQYLNTQDEVFTYNASVSRFDEQDVREADGGAPGGLDQPSDLGLPMRMRGRGRSPGGEPEVRKHDELRVQMGGEEAYPWTSERRYRQDDPDLQVMGRHEKPDHKPEGFCLEGLWWPGNQVLRPLGFVLELLGRYGGEASRLLNRKNRQRWGLRANQLLLDTEVGAVQESEATKAGSMQGDRSDFDYASVERVKPIGKYQTWGIGIEGTHSYVSEGVVNHNTVPKHTFWAQRLREAFVAPPGHVALALDFSQGELRVAADVANEPLMIQTYLTGGDLHMLTGKEVCGLTAEELKALSKDELKFVRQNGKAGNFGLLYGMGAEGFVAWAYKAYGVELSIEQAQDYIEKHFRMYRGLSAWHQRTKKMARMHGYVRSPLGRVRRVPLINSRNREVAAKQERQAINSQIQSTLSDMQLLAIANIFKRFGHESQMCVMIHDQVVRYVPEDRVQEGFKETLEIMENLPLHLFGWEPKVPFIADCEYGRNLGEMVEME